MSKDGSLSNGGNLRKDGALLFLFGCVAILTLLCSWSDNSMNACPFNEYRELIFAFREQQQKRFSIIRNQVQKDEGSHERYKKHEGYYRKFGNSGAYEKFTIERHKTLASAMVASLKKPIGIIWTYDIQYPTKSDGTCVEIKFEDAYGERYDAYFRENCSQVYKLLIRWVMNYRSSVKSIDGSTVSPLADGTYPKDAKFYGVVYRPENPAHFEMAYWRDKNRKQLVQKFMITDIVYDRKQPTIVSGNLLNENFELIPFTFDGWKTRNQLVMENAMEYKKHHDRSFPIHQVLAIEGKHFNMKNFNAEAIASQPCHLETILSSGKFTGFDITSEQESIIASIKKNEESMKIEWDPKGTICMKMEIKTTTGKEYFYATENCGNLFVEFYNMNKGD